MELVRKLDLSKVAAIDIETVRVEEHYKDLPDMLKGSWKYKNKQDPKQLAELWVRTSSLYPEFSKVCAVSISYTNKKGELECLEFADKEEKEILDKVCDIFDRLRVAGYSLAGHAAKYFAYPFLCKRYMINGMQIPAIIDTAHLKTWENPNICTNEIWRAGGTGPGSSLFVLCVALGIPVSKVDLVGDEVGQAYFKDEIDKIKRYCSLDAVSTMNILRKIQGMKPVEFDHVKFK